LCAASGDQGAFAVRLEEDVAMARGALNARDEGTVQATATRQIQQGVAARVAAQAGDDLHFVAERVEHCSGIRGTAAKARDLMQAPQSRAGSQGLVEIPDAVEAEAASNTDCGHQ
jgi:hypothetical protein